MPELNDNHASKNVRKYVREQNDYDILECIDNGCNGTVYFGKRKKLNDEIVLKFYIAQESYDPNEEAVVIKSIKHPNIIEIIDLRFVNPHFSLFISPRIELGNLSDLIKFKSISICQALNIVIGILSGLTELHHNHNIVHRDLKPDNILIDENMKPIIADLGSYKRMNGPERFVGTSKSTFLYLPHESHSEGKYYFQSDLYQVGIILYQLIGGKLPELSNLHHFLSQKQIQKLNGIKNNIEKGQLFNAFILKLIEKSKLVSTKTMPDYIDQDVIKLIKKATNVDVKKRHQTASDFINDIRKCLRNTLDCVLDSDCLHIKTKHCEYMIENYSSRVNKVKKRKKGASSFRLDNSLSGKDIKEVINLIKQTKV